MEYISTRNRGPAADVLKESSRGDGVGPVGLLGTERPQVHGKFLYWGGRKHYVCGVTYGTFKPNADSEMFPDRRMVAADVGLMAASGFNAVRTYTPPPEWLFDLFAENGLRVMVGLPWEQHIAFLDSRRRARAIRKSVRNAVKRAQRHPAILCYVVGNEIPSGIVRWHGREAVATHLENLYRITKDIDPEGLVTYVNYPSTEFLDLPFLDLKAFNVYLESPESFRAYLGHLHLLAAEKPLIMAEVGLDSIRNGEELQARSLDWQIRSSFAGGCAGVFAFKWTDEWHRGGNDINDWAFGLTTSDRVPKPSLAAVSRSMLDVPITDELDWPRVSVVVCSYNGAATIRDTLDALEKLEYPDYEVIVVNDGSTDETERIALQYNCEVVSLPNGGLSNARNVGMRRATGDIVAYIDDDAYPDPHWLKYLAHSFMTREVCGVGGPNLLPPQDGFLAECISHAPGGPCHVLETDDIAEHIPGCNMAFRRSALEAVGGFDAQFHTAGDDVDLCWRMIENGWKIGFHPSAVVWHHRRPSLRAYWKQQFGYGKAEALLERKWPEKYNRLGHIPWSGRIYGRGLTKDLAPLRNRIYQGMWGQAPFQSLYQRAPGTWLALPLMPEWYLTVFLLIGLVGLSFLWSPLSLAIPVLCVAVAAPILQAVISANAARLDKDSSYLRRLKKRAVIAYLHLLQPIARLYGRLKHGLTVWRRRGAPPKVAAIPRTDTLWSERWRSPGDWLTGLESALIGQGAVVLRGGDFNRWDLEVRGGLFGSARILMTIEEHGNGKQMLRFRARPVLSGVEIGFVVFPTLLFAVAVAQGALVAGMILLSLGFAILVWQLNDCSVSLTSHLLALEDLRKEEEMLQTCAQAELPGLEESLVE